MCGLVGCADTWMSANETKMYRTLANLNYERGIHSAGATICYEAENKKKEKGYYVTNIHAMGHPANLAVEEPEFFDAKAMFKPSLRMRFVLGHSRHATIGNVNKDNAHPFQHGKIYGMHNGTLNEHIMNKEERWDDFETDSEWIIWHLSEYGVDATIPKLSGAYALIWFDMKDQKIYFIRNGQRPLHYSQPNGGRTMFWSSDKDYLNFALAKNNRTCKEVKEFKVNTLYSYHTNPPKGQYKFDEVFVEEKELLGKLTYRTPSNTQYGTTWWKDRNKKTGGGSNTTTTKHTPKNNVIDMSKKRRETRKEAQKRLDMRTYKDLVGKNIQFFVDTPRDIDGQQACKIHPIEAEIPIGFVFRTSLFKNVNLDHCTFCADIKQVVPRFVDGSWIATILIDNRTLTCIEEGKSDEPEAEMFQGYNGEPLTKEQYERKLEEKCANCSSDEELGNASFFSRNEWLCMSCETQGLMNNIPILN